MANESGVTVTRDNLREFVTQLFQTYCFPREDAFAIADHLVEADLRGVYSHGVLRIEPYLERVQVGMNTRPNIHVIRETASTAVIHGDDGIGQVVGLRAMKLAIKKARETGISYVGVRMSNHFGMCGYYAEMALPEDMIGIAATLSGTNIMAPTGGITPLLGNNPFAVAIPAGKERPVVLDMAQSVVARGKIGHAVKTGSPIPPTWALNKYGEPTTDAKEGFEGLVQPVGGYKGYGMAFVTMVLGGVLTGAAFAKGIPSFEEGTLPNQDTGHFFQAINIAAFMNPTEFKEKMDQAIRAMHESELARGTDRIYVPGEMEWIRREERLASGIPVAAGVWNDLTRMAGERGVPLPPTL